MLSWFLVLAGGVFLLVGLAAARWTSASDGNVTDFMIAGQRLPLWVACLTLAATWIGGGYINGSAEAVYDPELGLVWCQAPWCYAVSLMLGGLVFARPMRDRGYRTMLDLFAERYGPRIAAALSVPALVGDLFWTAAILAALGTTLGALLQTSVVWTTVFSAGIVIVYTYWGGLWSVALSDIVQLVCIAFGLTLALPFVLSEVGGVDAMLTRYQTQFGERAGMLPPAATWTGEGWGWQWLDSALCLSVAGSPGRFIFKEFWRAATAAWPCGCRSGRGSSASWWPRPRS